MTLLSTPSNLSRAKTSRWWSTSSLSLVQERTTNYQCITLKGFEAQTLVIKMSPDLKRCSQKKKSNNKTRTLGSNRFLEPRCPASRVKSKISFRQNSQKLATKMTNSLNGSLWFSLCSKKRERKRPVTNAEQIRTPTTKRFSSTKSFQCPKSNAVLWPTWSGVKKEEAVLLHLKLVLFD